MEEGEKKAEEEAQRLRDEGAETTTKVCIKQNQREKGKEREQNNEDKVVRTSSVQNIVQRHPFS